jgi:hypothetical membrane protein
LIKRLALPLALIAALAMVGGTVIGGALFPGYSHAAQFMSELGATGAPHEWPMRLGSFLPAGVALLMFAWVAYRSLPQSAPLTLGLLGLTVYALGYVVAVFFPCDFGCRPAAPSLSQIIHNLVGGIGYVVAPVMLVLLGVGVRGLPQGVPLSNAAFALAPIALVGMVTLSPKLATVGLSQRAIELSVLTWIALLAWYIRRRP